MHSAVYDPMTGSLNVRTSLPAALPSCQNIRHSFSADSLTMNKWAQAPHVPRWQGLPKGGTVSPKVTRSPQ